MIKEKLTLKDIKSDLKYTIKNSYIALVLFVLLFVMMFVLFLLLGEPKGLFSIHQIYFGVMAFVFLLAVFIQMFDIIRLHGIYSKGKCIVKDKLIATEIKDHVNRTGTYQTYHLYFSGYGEYIIPYENYTWSSLYSLSEEGLYNYSICGDEFYLVLSKPHTGKILFVYNTKMFDLQK